VRSFDSAQEPLNDLFELHGLTKPFLEASLNQKGPKGEFVVVIYSEPYAVIEYEGVKLRREAKEHAATRIFDAQQSPFKGLVFFASFFLQ
jgi:hypothetical protein